MIYSTAVVRVGLLHSGVMIIKLIEPAINNTTAITTTITITCKYYCFYRYYR